MFEGGAAFEPLAAVLRRARERASFATIDPHAEAAGWSSTGDEHRATESGANRADSESAAARTASESAAERADSERTASEARTLEPATFDSDEADVCAPVGADSHVARAAAAVRRFQAALADALDVSVDVLLRDVAALVLARELQLAPCDLSAIVASALARYRAEVPVAVCVHPEDRAFVETFGLPLEIDSQLRRGDALLRVRSGTIDLSLGARLAAVLAS